VRGGHLPLPRTAECVSLAPLRHAEAGRSLVLTQTPRESLLTDTRAVRALERATRLPEVLLGIVRLYALRRKGAKPLCTLGCPLYELVHSTDAAGQIPVFDSRSGQKTTQNSPNRTTRSTGRSEQKRARSASKVLPSWASTILHSSKLHAALFFSTDPQERSGDQNDRADAANQNRNGSATTATTWNGCDVTRSQATPISSSSPAADKQRAAS